ncbi:MAG: TetR/AcrR family transcriptional regulator [Clostridia bacterium]|nr:TetR/AcrR family transcriptional regulator [Clostridia bacterium]
MWSKRGDRLKEKTFDRKTELFEAALNEFSEKSYEDASLNTILKRAAISKGVFYYHFADKQALYLFLLGTAEKAKWDFINEKTSHNPDLYEGGNIFETIRLQARLGAEFALTHPDYHKLGRMLSKTRGTPVYIAAKDYLGGDSGEKLTGMIATAIANGDLRSTFSEEFLTKILAYLLNGFDEIFNAEEDGAPDRLLLNLDTYIDFIRRGMER